MSTLSLNGFLKEISSGPHLFPRHFSAFIDQQVVGLCQEDRNLLKGLTSLLLYQQSRGHVCLDLANPVVFQKEDSFHPVELPPAGEILEAFQQMPSTMLSKAGTNSPTPLLYTDGSQPLLYLYRYWRYERDLEERLRKLLANTDKKKATTDILDRLVQKDKDVSEKQREAVENALASNFSIIAGGPGTGKTTIAVKVIAAKLLENQDLSIALAAPTGKAAKRMEDAISGAVRDLPIPDNLKDGISDLRASTIHRLLGPQFNSPYFKHNSDNPLPCDFILVDESSMIDLPMMAKLLDAIGPDTAFVLVGDPYQLPSVEVGSIFGDMVNAEEIKRVVTTLTENFRAKDAPDIIKLCDWIKQGDETAVKEALKLLKSSASKAEPTGPQLEWKQVKDGSSLHHLVNIASKRYREIFKDPEGILKTSTRFRILTTLKRGPFGSSYLNRQIKAKLNSDHELIIITKNDPETDLYNGDTGVLTSVEGRKTAQFSDKDKPISALRLPDYESAYAMTGHKAQGSEFDEVHIVLPTDENCPLLTREWLYTAVSRAKKKVVIWASEEAIAKSLQLNTNRVSGLMEK